MMRIATAAVLLGFGSAVLAMPPSAQAGYYCSPGFEATYGGRCVATTSRDEIDLYRNEPVAEAYVPPVRHHRRHRHGLRRALLSFRPGACRDMTISRPLGMPRMLARPGAGHRFQKIAFLSAGSPESDAARDDLARIYGNASEKDADVVVALGGDGLMLQTLHRFMGTGVPIFGMNRGSVGFLMNEPREIDLMRRLDEAQPSIIHPLVMKARTGTGRGPRGQGVQRGLPVAPNLSGRQAADFDRWSGAPDRADR